MEDALIKKMMCPNCGRTNLVKKILIDGTISFKLVNWLCAECHTSFDTNVWIGNDGIVYQQALGSATMQDYQAYNNQKIKLNR